MKKIVRGKKGVETSTMIVWIAVAVAGAIIVLLFFSNSFGFFSDTIDKADIDTTLIAQKCNLYSEIDNSGYCTDKIEIATNQYINCEYAKTEFGIMTEGPVCKDRGNEKYICNKLKAEEGETTFAKIKVNGVLCTEWEKATSPSVVT